MQIIIPMSGQGSRFKAAGYSDPKPLIPVLGKPIIEWVTQMFPGEDNFLFICNREHLEKTAMRQVIERISPGGKIVSIEPHKKGPVYAVAKAFDAVDPQAPSLVSYCDYYQHWDYSEFKKQVSKRECGGAIPCYTGFHPHLLPKGNLYASCRVDSRQNLIEIREKHSFENDKSRALHSPGVYYFQNGALVRKYFEKMLQHGEALNGEYYVSLVYNLLVGDGLEVWCPPSVSHFCQWGTPEDLEEFLFWMNCLKGQSKW